MDRDEGQRDRLARVPLPHLGVLGDDGVALANHALHVVLEALHRLVADADPGCDVSGAVGATVRNIAEGANRVHPKDKAARFIVARAECGECEASLEMVEVLRLANARRLRMMADRVAAMGRRLRARQAFGVDVLEQRCGRVLFAQNRLGDRPLDRVG